MSNKEMAIHLRQNSGNCSHCPMGTMFAKSDVNNLEKVSRLVIATFYTSMHQTSVLN